MRRGDYAILVFDGEHGGSGDDGRLRVGDGALSAAMGLWEVGGVVCAVNIVSRLRVWLVWAALCD
jgi:hypothetical protein